MNNCKNFVLFSFLGLGVFFANAQTTGFAPSKGVKIYYKLYGEGIPLLIINGGPGMNSNGFEGFANELSKDFMVILFDQRGTGKSTLSKVDETTITMDLMVEDMEALRNHLSLKSWHVLGHSFGGLLASLYATKHPECIDKLVYSSSGGLDLGFLSYINDEINAKLSSENIKNLALWSQKINAGDTTYHARYQRGLALAPAYVYNKKFVPQLADRLTQGNTTINQLVFKDLNKINYNCNKELLSFTKPVLIIQGNKDIIREETALNAKKTFQNATMLILPNCGHYGWLDQPLEYLNSIKGFLNETY